MRLRVKQEADGWPKNAGEDEEKRCQYIQDYLKREDIPLRPERIEKNSGITPPRQTYVKLILGKILTANQVHEFVDPP